MTNKTLIILTLVLGVLFLALNIMISNPIKSHIQNQNKKVNSKNISPKDSTGELKTDH